MISIRVTGEHAILHVHVVANEVNSTARSIILTASNKFTC